MTIPTAGYCRAGLDTGGTKGLAVAGDCEGMNICFVFSWEVNRMLCTLVGALVTWVTSTPSFADRGIIAADNTGAHNDTLTLLAGVHDGHVIL